MIKIQNITILGTSHVAKQSTKQIKDHIKNNLPEIVAIELDSQRLISLIKKQKPSFSITQIKQVGLIGYLFLLIGGTIQRFIAKRLNIMPGADMYTAFKQAKKNNLKVALIDQNIRITLKKFSKSFGSKDFFNMILDFFSSLIFPKKQIKKFNIKNFDLKKVPEDQLVEAVIKNIKHRYPGIYKTLIHDRNKIMAHNLSKLTQTFPSSRILAVVGKGHEKGIAEILAKTLNTHKP